MRSHAAAGHQGTEGEAEAGWHGGSGSGRLMRQGSTSSYVTTSRPDTASQSGLLEHLMSQDNGLQVILLHWDMQIDVVLEDGESSSAGKCCSCQCCVYADCEQHVFYI